MLKQLQAKIAIAHDITREELQEVICYDRETGDFTWGKLGKPGRWGFMAQFAGTPAGMKSDKPDQYLQIRLGGDKIQAHRLAWFLAYGYWTEKRLDHINGDKHDNRIANLRECTAGENAMNTGLRINNKTGITGVIQTSSGKWMAQIWCDRKKIHLGTFESKQDAADARYKKEVELFGEFARQHRD